MADDMDYGYGSDDMEYGERKPMKPMPKREYKPKNNQSSDDMGYGYGDAAPDYGYGDDNNKPGGGSNDMGYGDAAPDMGYGNAAPDMGYGNAAPDMGYGYASSDDGMGYGDAKPDESAPAPARKNRPKRRCSVTKYILDEAAQAQQNHQDVIEKMRNAGPGGAAPAPAPAATEKAKSDDGTAGTSPASSDEADEPSRAPRKGGKLKNFRKRLSVGFF